MVFTGLSAFPLTPVTHDAVDLGAYRGLVTRLVDAGVDSIGALGSTGSYAYLSRAERREVTAATLQCADGVPVIVGTGALRTGHVQALTEDAQSAGAAAVMIAPVSYQPLTEDEVYSLYEDVAAGLSVPLVVYDNPGTTGFTFSLDLYAGITRLPHVAAIKIRQSVTSPPRERGSRRSARLSPITYTLASRAMAPRPLACWPVVTPGTAPWAAPSLTRCSKSHASRLAETSERRRSRLGCNRCGT